MKKLVNKKGSFFSKIVFIMLACFLIICLSSVVFADEGHSDAGQDETSYSEDEDLKIADSGHGVSHSSGHSSSHSSSRSRSSSSSRSRSSSSSSSSGRSGSGGSLPAAAIAMVFSTVMFIMIVSIVISMVASKSHSSYTSSTQNFKVNDEEIIKKIKQYIPNFDKEQFLKNGYRIYIDVQNAWMNFKLDDVKNVITDEMYNMYESQLDIMQTKGEQNIMKDFKEIAAFVKDVVVQNNDITITAMYVVEFYDYIADAKTGKVLTGTNRRKLRVTYEMKFRKSLTADKDTKCPNCGAKIEYANGSAVCKYCGSKLVYDNSDWVLTNKKTVYQTWA